MSNHVLWNRRLALPAAALLATLLLAPMVSAQAETTNAFARAETTRVAAASTTEITPEVACEAGSLHDCELLYCSNGISEQCRKHVLQTAQISSDTWYLRKPMRSHEDGTTTYAIRCMTKETRPLRDATITCTAQPGPNRCSIAAKAANSSYSRMDKAASGYCSAT